MARNNASNFVAGRLAEVAIWKNVVLTSAEAAILGLGYAPPLVRPGSLSLYWPLLTGNSPETELISNTGFNLTGSPTNTPHPTVLYPTGVLLTDNAAANSSFAVNVSDAATGSESVTLSPLYNVSVSDAATLAEAITMSGLFGISVADGATVTDTPQFARMAGSAIPLPFRSRFRGRGRLADEGR
jgi:hypothetical protein